MAFVFDHMSKWSRVWICIWMHWIHLRQTKIAWRIESQCVELRKNHKREKNRFWFEVKMNPTFWLSKIYSNKNAQVFTWNSIGFFFCTFFRLLNFLWHMIKGNVRTWDFYRNSFLLSVWYSWQFELFQCENICVASYLRHFSAIRVNNCQNIISSSTSKRFPDA